MTIFDEREQAFEAKFAHDQEVEFKAHARRDRLLGLWAAERMGLSPESAEQYAAVLVRADIGRSGEDDVARKVIQDLSASNVAVPEAVLHQKMDELLAQAREQIRSGL
ncbi:DUF1476 domain-containing protein [Caulobacter sp. 17J65-9]|uniref:DUF1476 domain-containing protein n=1 Tax=Caulobacter sp. 17J65-9 TaxID=2709382 RepID=UPI0013C5F2AF|nr:DUF1476 domain-containing protein [Caulobacter sp. 17J65-9]NEX94293.1 DUF1476 domain-containing protein [Caulobacter sp. 17J65-9]